MRYLKSAAFLLLTASSSVSLLPTAKAVPNSAKSVEDLESVDDREAKVTSSTEAHAHAENIAQASPLPNAAQPELAPSITDAPLPQFARLKHRLLGDGAQPLPVETANHAVNSQARSLQASNTQVIAVEVVEEADVSEEPQADSFIQPPELTLDSFRDMVNQGELSQRESEIEVVGQIEVVDQTAPQAATQGQAIAQNDESEEATPEALPTLEEPTNQVEPTDEESEDTEASDPDETGAEEADSEETDSEETDSEENDTPPNDTPPTAPQIETDLENEPASAGPDESIPAPTATDETEIGELPAILFADPNPLSFPTSTEEVDIEQSPTITLEQAIELAYRNSQAIQASVLGQEQATAAVDEARAALLPSVSTQADLTTRESTQVNPFTGESSSDLDTTLGASISVNYNLLTGGGREASIRAAELNEEIATLTLEAQQEQIRLATATAYYALQEAGEDIGINQAFLDEAARNLRDAQLRQEVGVGTKFDVLRAEVQFANARQQLIQSQSQQQISRRDISRLLNLPPNASISATPVARAENWPLTLEESIVLAFQNRAELEQQLLQADISEQQRRAALAAIRPQVGLFANYSIPDFFDDDDGLQDNYSFGAQLNWTIFDGGAARASARQQAIASDISEEQFSETLDQVRFDVEQSFFNLQASEENIATSEVAVSQAEEALALANLRLQAGVGTQLDVLTAQSELADARSNNVTAILGYNRALVSIERAISNVATPF